MKSPFPEKTVSRIEKEAERILKIYGKESKSKYQRTLAVNHGFSEGVYGFKDNLLTGNFAPYPHEERELGIHEQNCTTIIPGIFLYAQAFGLDPKIVQFIGFRDIKTKKDLEDPLTPSHFAIIMDAGRKYPYLVDPQWKTFGPLREVGENYMKIGESEKYLAKKREFRQAIYYSAEDFVKMMDRLHDPAESLDMLVTGQRIFGGRDVQKVGCELKIYYCDEDNTITTKLYIPQPGILNKAVNCKMQLDYDGSIINTSLEFFSAKDISWAGLKDEKKIAHTDFSTILKLKNKIKKIGKPGKQLKMGAETVKHILELTDIVDKMVPDERDMGKIEPQILARTLYETEKPESEYLFSEQERDSRRLEMTLKLQELDREISDIDNILYLHKSKLRKIDENEARRLKRKMQNLDRQSNETYKDYSPLKHQSKDNRKAYHRAMDMVLFAKTIEKKSVDELRRMVTEKGQSPLVGYTAMVNDFIPFAFEARDDLELKHFFKHIRIKVKARRAKYHQKAA